MNFFELDPLLQIILVIILLGAIVAVLRFLLRLARRVLACGCVLVLVGGSILVLFNAVGWIMN